MIGLNDEIDNLGLLYICTIEHRLKMFKTLRMVFTESVYQNLKDAGFNNLYDIIKNPEDTLKAVGTDEKEIEDFSKALCFCCQCFKILPLDFDYRLMFTEDTINRVKEAIEKNKLEILSEDKACNKGGK